jgi:hypothetical protein
LLEKIKYFSYIPLLPIIQIVEMEWGNKEYTELYIMASDKIYKTISVLNYYLLNMLKHVFIMFIIVTYCLISTTKFMFSSWLSVTGNWSDMHIQEKFAQQCPAYSNGWHGQESGKFLSAEWCVQYVS